MSGRTPVGVTRALREIGEDLATWRKLRRLTMAEVAERADVGINTVQRLEKGAGATLENVLRVARALGVLEALTASLDPYQTDLGRLRSDEALPERIRHPRTP
jgi:transcriptional regulator with XRE-family HTH domain